MLPLHTWLCLLLTCHLVTSLEYGANPCSADWVDGTLVGMGCLLFDSSISSTWDDANIYCQSIEDSKLVSIETEEQFDFVRMELDFLDSHEEKHGWWTSGTDKGREGKWNWTFPIIII